MKRYYEHIITACGFLAMFVNVGLVSTAFNVFQPYIVAIPGVGDVGGSAVLSVRMAVSLAAMLFVDRFYQALNCRRGVVLATMFSAAGLVVFSFAQGLPLLLVGACLCGLGYGFGGMVCVTILTNRWYKGHVATPIGIAAVGSGAAGIVAPIVATAVVESVSLSAAFLLEAAVAATVGVALAALVRNTPADMGREPALRQGKVVQDGGSSETLPKPNTASPLDDPRSKALLFASVVFVGAMCISSMAYLGVLLKEGFDPLFVAALISAAGAALTFGKFLTGELFDRVGTTRGSAVMFASSVLGFVLLVFAPLGAAPVAILGAVLVGMGVSLGTVGVSVWSLELSDESRRSRTIKDFQVCYALGGLAMNVLPGPLKALTGTYATSYAIFAVLALAAAVVIVGMYRKTRG